MDNINIKKIDTASHLNSLVQVIRESFLDVAEKFGLTPENAPTNPAFITCAALQESINRGLIMFGAFPDNALIGCIGIKDSGKNNVFFIERLAVLPQFRHKGYGRKLLDFACSEIAESGGNTAAIGIIDENAVLKQWYRNYGFTETGIKRFPHLPFTVCFMEKDRLPVYRIQ